MPIFCVRIGVVMRFSPVCLQSIILEPRSYRKLIFHLNLVYKPRVVAINNKIHSKKDIFVRSSVNGHYMA